MSTPVIEVESISKRYRIGLKEKRKDTLLGQIGSALRAPLDNFRQLRSLSKFNENEENIFWALRDINFEVQQGEVLGIIGHNGAGKSTLLKILSRITEPTDGRITIQGRISALLEVGTGFHPELTGRDNIYMNGTILGMSRREIDHKLDEIVDFSGVEKYIDTPVKFYSSGMKVRLGFAVAAHLEPEILVIDEVLSVGDAEFQKKCLGKIKDVSGNGRTVLFVSHNMGAVKGLCHRAIVLKNGQLVYSDETQKAISFYQKTFSQNDKACIEWSEAKAPGDHRARLLSILAEPIWGDHISISSGIKLIFRCKSMIKKATLDITYNITNQDEVLLINHGSLIATQEDLVSGIYEIIAEIPPFLLNEGDYTLDVWMGLGGTERIGHKVDDAISFYVESDKVDGTLKKLPGVLRPQITYQSQLLSYAEAD